MPAALSLSEDVILAALRTFLLGILPPGTEVVRAQANRVPEPEGDNFVVMTPVLRQRLSTNVVSTSEAHVTGSIAGTVMTVSEILLGELGPGQALAGDGIAPYSSIVGILSGTPGAEEYRITPSQTVSAGSIYAGGRSAVMATQITVQLDVHGPVSADNAQIIATLFRDGYGCEAMAASGFEIAPLYAGEPHQTPFINAEQQFEDRWVIDAVLQANPVVTTPQQFAGAAVVGLISVDAVYPPGAQ